jgi:hypothetical protein
MTPEERTFRRNWRPWGDNKADFDRDYRSLIRAVRLQEREECAKVAEDEKVDADDTKHEGDYAYNRACEDIAAAIRERKP